MWDPLNRLASYTASSTTTNYTYRSDGLRVFKSSPSATTSFAYDGQMGFEDVDTGARPAVTDYGIGPRGIDRIAKTASGTTAISYPLYDGHGNMIATLSEGSGGTYTGGNIRAFDAWGNIRSAQTTGDPNGQYCASVGHKHDDESGLVYMRARYYDAGAGRFVSQDHARSSANFYTYCLSDPINCTDSSGQFPQLMAAFIVGFLAGLISDILIQMAKDPGNFIQSVQDINMKEALAAGFVGGVIGVFLAAGGLALTALGEGMGSALIQDLGAVFTALSTGCSAKTLAGLLLGGVIGGLAYAAGSLWAYSVQLQMAMQDPVMP